MVVWTDNFDGVRTSMLLMQEIMEACNDKWVVMEVLNDHMASLRRTRLELNMASY